MISSRALGKWCLVHKWSSLVCTLFLLILCLTGLPLIFHDEIDGLARSGQARIAARPGEPLLALDEIVAVALREKPGDVPLYMSFDEDRPVVNITTGPEPHAPESRMSFFPIDRRTGKVAEAERGGGMIDVLLQIHKDLFLGMPGMLFLGLMGLLFFTAVISGVVIYSPFMRKLDFGTVRRSKSARTKWLDWHNLLGVVTLAWAGVVGLTGTINTLADPITAWWRTDELAAMTPRADGPVEIYRPGVAGRAVAAAMTAAPNMRPQFVAFPGVAFSSNGHLAVFLQGATPLTKKLLTPVLVDARTGKVDAIAPMPWYMKALLLSQPLHFGDYGGMPMKILWALFDLVTIVVLGSGLYLWLGKRKRPRAAT